MNRCQGALADGDNRRLGQLQCAVLIKRGGLRQFGLAQQLPQCKAQYHFALPKRLSQYGIVIGKFTKRLLNQCRRMP